jgi:hypothetical protein
MLRREGLLVARAGAPESKGIIGAHGFGSTMIVGEPCPVLFVGVEIVEDDFEPSLWIRRDNLIP